MSYVLLTLFSNGVVQNYFAPGSNAITTDNYIKHLMYNTRTDIIAATIYSHPCTSKIFSTLVPIPPDQNNYFILD